MSRTPRSLRVRVLVANLAVAAATLGTVIVAVSLVGPGYFAEAMGHRPGDPMGSMMEAATRAAFDDAITEALVAGGLIAVLTSVLVGIALSGAIARPVAGMAAAARRIASGHYAERVAERGSVEFVDLAASFNVMTGALEATEQRRLQLVGDVAHELRTPLTTLDGYLEGLEDGVVPPTTETWRLLRVEAARLRRLVDDLQELWRAEAHQLPLRLEAIDASAVALEVVDRFRSQAADKHIRLSATAPTGSRPVRADRERLAQILGNFVSNAIRYSPEGGRVTIQVLDSDGHIVFDVVDHGPGLTPEQREHVFDRFYRVDPSRSRALGGSGIGLAIARALAEAMGGHVEAESAGPGLGSTFRLELVTAA
jgi:signal transduction histidine kinase